MDSWQFEDTLKGQRNDWPKANKTKKKGEALLLFIFYKASVKSALKDNLSNCKNCHPFNLL